MCDLVNRQAVIEMIKDWNLNQHIMNEEDAMDDVNALPSAEPKKGEWIDYTDEGFVECPFCHSATNCDGNKDELHYCFSCGAELRGEQK